MAGYPSYTQRKKLVELVIERDGYKCYLCNMGFKDPKDVRLEHIENRVPLNNDLDNLALAHQSCNTDKAKNLHKYIDIIEQKLEENRNAIYVRERNPKKKSASTEIEISNACYSITRQYLVDEILQNGWIDYKETLPSITFLCREKVGHGSINQIRNHLEVLTSIKAPFMIDKDPNTKKKIIRKRPQ
ncbi:MAG: HNH endonuclease [Nitrosopumilus sp.]